jgi:Trk K+ transport system NAD-binding subunit
MMRAMSDNSSLLTNAPWRSVIALLLFASAVLGFQLGVSVSERPGVHTSGLLTQAYYSLSLFVVGGVDLGAPQGGPVIGRMLLWLAYFGCPILAVSTLIEAFLRAVAPPNWHLRKLKNHVVVIGDGPLAISYLRVLRSHNRKVPLVVVISSADPSREEEIKERFGAVVAQGDTTHEFFLQQLRVQYARKVLLLDNHSLRSYETASILMSIMPDIGNKIVIHCGTLRFMRAMENTLVATYCETFNTYHLAASGLVRSHMLHHFKETHDKDVVILAGFGRFGQTILEELQFRARGELDAVAVIDVDAQRRVLVADEQTAFAGEYHRKVYEGNISHPEVWDRLRHDIDIGGDNTVFVLGTGKEEDNLRTALWLRRKYPGAMVIARSDKTSRFASGVGEEHNIITISITQLVEENIPSHWIDLN